MKITVWNEQGATDVKHVDSRDAVAKYLDTWSDPHNLKAEVTDQYGNVLATKPMGETEIQWVENA